MNEYPKLYIVSLLLLSINIEDTYLNILIAIVVLIFRFQNFVNIHVLQQYRENHLIVHFALKKAIMSEQRLMIVVASQYVLSFFIYSRCDLQLRMAEVIAQFFLNENIL